MEFKNLRRQYDLLKDNIDKAIETVICNADFISGKEIIELEKTLSDYVGVKNCITCANGTDALSIALKAWGIKKGMAVFVPDFTFFSTGECVASEGATPFFVDVDKNTFNIDTEKLEKTIIKVRDEGKYEPKAVIAVDLFGRCADYLDIRIICDKYNLLLLEDGAQGFGGNINGKRACSFGDISTTSFFPAKPLGCYGDGGAIFTDNDEWAMIIRSLCVHGKDVSNNDNPNAKYNNVRVGLNSRLDTIQAAIIMAKFDVFKKYELDRVNKVADWYNEGLMDTDLIVPLKEASFFSAWAQYTVQLPDYVDRVALQSFLKANDVPTMIYYRIPMHNQLAFDGTDSSVAECHVTEELCKTVLSLPIDPYIERNEVDYVIEKIRMFLSRS